MIEQIENKNSSLREENVDVKEQLNRALLEKDCLRQEQGETADALQKIELQNAELEVEINRLRSEEASLRDSLLKMQALNEGLGQDKIELNRIVMQLEQDKGALEVRVNSALLWMSVDFQLLSCLNLKLFLYIKLV